MSLLKLSEFSDIRKYRANSQINDNDLIEVSISTIGDNFSSRSLSIGYIKQNIAPTINTTTTQQAFDIIFRSCVDTPKLAEVWDDDIFIGDIYSAWPLFTDSTRDIPDLNRAAPNWLNKAYISDCHMPINALYPEFWNKLLSMAATSSVAYEYCDANSDSSVSGTLYMSDINTYGYTARFLIDINGFVALPILNNSFLGTPFTSSELFSSVSDAFSSHTHTLTYNQVVSTSTNITSSALFAYNKNIMSSNYENLTLTGNVNTTNASAITETSPKNVTIGAYMVIANNITSDSFSGTTNINQNTLPLGVIQGFALTAPPDSNWLVCNGQIVNTIDYPGLAALLGITEDTFALPNLMNRYLTSDSEAGTDYIDTNVDTLLDHRHGAGYHTGSVAHWFINRAWSEPSQSYNLISDAYGYGYSPYSSTTGNMFVKRNINNSTTPINSLQFLNTVYILPCIKAK